MYSATRTAFLLSETSLSGFPVDCIMEEYRWTISFYAFQNLAARAICNIH